MVPPVWTQRSLSQKSGRTSGYSPTLTHGPLRQPTLKSHLLDEMKMGCDRLTDGESATRCARVSVELPSSTSPPSRASIPSSPPKTSGQGPAATSMLPQPAGQAQSTSLKIAGYWRWTKKSITLTLNFCFENTNSMGVFSCSLCKQHQHFSARFWTAEMSLCGNFKHSKHRVCSLDLIFFFFCILLTNRFVIAVVTSGLTD